MTPNPRIMRALAKSALTGNDHLPVDTMNSNLIRVDDLPSLPNPKKKKLIDFRGKRSVSYQLRFLYLALEKWSADRGGYKLSFVTVHFNHEEEERLKKAKKGPAGAFADLLQKALKALGYPANFFMALEEGKTENKRLHAHIVISHHESDQAVLIQTLRRYASSGPSGIDIRDYYKLFWTPNPAFFEAGAVEMDIEHGDISYLPDPRKPGRYYRNVALNIGVADYISKHLLSNRVRFKGIPFYAPQALRREATALFSVAYQQQQALKADGAL